MSIPGMSEGTAYRVIRFYWLMVNGNDKYETPSSNYMSYN